MAQNNANQQLNDLLISKNFDPQALDSMGKPAQSPEQADLFSFDYIGESGQDYGTVVIMINNSNDLNVYFGDNVGKSMEGEDKKGWFDFLYQLRQFAKRNLMSFSLQNLNKLKYSMQGQAAIKEGLFEGWNGTKNTSWNGVETEARLMIKHKKTIGESDARYRYIQSLFVETAEGERYKLPFTKLSAGRAMLEHVRQGGKPYDIRGNHIATIVEEMNLLSRFKRANQGKIFEGETQHLVEQATHYYETLQSNLKSLSTKNGYAKYFESWDPAALSDEDVIIEDLRHMFVEQNIDSRIEQALPLLAKLQREQSMKEANIFEDWANLIVEGTWAVPDTKEKQSQLVELLSQELPVGPDATNATELLYNLLGDDELFDRLEELAEQDANADARNIILTRLEQLKSNPDIAQVIGQLKTPQEPVQEGFNTYDMDNTPCPKCHEKELTYHQGSNHVSCGACGKGFSLAGKQVNESAGDVMFKHQDKLDRLERLRDLARRIGNTEKASALDTEIKAIYAANPVGSQDKGHLEEFAPSSERDDDGSDDVPNDILELANRWWNAAGDQPRIENVLRSLGWSIHQVESEDDAVQLMHNDGTVHFISADEFDPEMFEVKDARTQTEDPLNTPQPEVTPNTLSELSSDTLKSYIKKAGSSSHERSASNLASRAADKLHTGNQDDVEWDDGSDDDHKSFMRSKGIARAVDKLEELSPDTLGSYIKKASSDRAMKNFDQGVDLGVSYGEREPKFDAEKDRQDDNRRRGIHKAVNRLVKESGMSEVDLLLQDIARGNVDIYDIFAAPKSNVEKFVSNQIHEKAEEVAREQGYNLDDDIEDILARVQRELEAEYGVDDNMDIELEGAIGKTLGGLAGVALVGGPADPLALYAGPAGMAIGDKIGDKIAKKIGWDDKEEEVDEAVSRDELVHQLSQVQNQIEKIVQTGGRVGLNDPLSRKMKMLKDKIHAAKAVKESTALAGQYGHSGKMEPFTGNDPDTIARIQALAGVRSSDVAMSEEIEPAVQDTESQESGLLRMKSLAGIFIR